MAKLTKSDRESLEDRAQRCRDELDSIGTRKGELQNEAAALQASLPALQFGSKIEKDPAKTEALKAGQDRIAEIMAIVIALDWRSDELRGLLVALDSELSGRKRAADADKLRAAEAAVMTLVDEFTKDLLQARMVIEKIATTSSEIAGLELALGNWDSRVAANVTKAALDGVAIDPVDDISKHSWNRWRRICGQRAHEIFKLGKWGIPLDAGSHEARTEVEAMLRTMGIKVLERQMRGPT